MYLKEERANRLQVTDTDEKSINIIQLIAELSLNQQLVLKMYTLNP